MFMTNLENVGDQYELLKPWTDIGLQWATKYYIRMDDTDAYVVTMCKSLNQHIAALPLTFSLIPTVLNPNVRLSWMEEQWEGVYFRNAKEIILDLVSTIHCYHYMPFSAISHADAPVP
jgi:hypothetical protein